MISKYCLRWRSGAAASERVRCGRSDWAATAVGQDAAQAATWALACQRGDRVPRGEYQQESVRRRRLRNVPNPFDPLLAIWARGYALDHVGEQAVVLVAPQA